MFNRITITEAVNGFFVEVYDPNKGLYHKENCETKVQVLALIQKFLIKEAQEIKVVLEGVL